MSVYYLFMAAKSESRRVEELFTEDDVKNPQFVWIPKDKNRKYWAAWARHNKKLVVKDLNLNYEGWKEESISVVKVRLIEEHKRKR